MPDHQGRRRRQSRLPLRRIAVLALALAVVGVLVWLPEPDRTTAPAAPLAVAPTRVGAATVETPGWLSDGTPYRPRIFVASDVSLGLATTRDSGSVRLILVGPHGRSTELRRLAATSQPQFSGFTAAGDTVVWAESIASGNADVKTTLWRTNWRTAAKPVAVTSATGEVSFFGSQFDLVLHGGRLFWVASVAGATDVRSVAVTGGPVTTVGLRGDFALTAWPWAASVDGGRGKPVRLHNYATKATLSLPTTPDQLAICAVAWCRVGVLQADALDHIELVKPDGSGRRRIAGNEATPGIFDVALLDRYVPLITDRGGDGASSVAGLSLYDIATGQTALIATDVDNVQGNGALLWWSVGENADLTWHAIDLRTLA